MGIVLSKWRLSLAAGATAGMLTGANLWFEEREADQREADRQLAAGIAGGRARACPPRRKARVLDREAFECEGSSDAE